MPQDQGPLRRNLELTGLKLFRRSPSTTSGDALRTKICLHTPDWMTWWKAITVHENNRFLHEIVYNQDHVHEKCNYVMYTDMLERYVVLSKAKSFGAHTNMYWIQNSYMITPDYDWDFYWLQD